MIHGHGNDKYKYKNIIADFSSNIKYGGADKGLLQFLRSTMDTVSDYPEPSADSATYLLADLLKIPADNILLTNGATEAFYLTAQLFARKKSLITYPSFAEYEDACRVFDHQIDFVEYAKIQAVNLSQYDTVWIANPNNPDGQYIEVDVLHSIIQRTTDTLFIIDEAYIDFHLKAKPLNSIQPLADNAVIIRSMTKAFAIPGLRLGYIIAQKKVIDKLKDIKMPWSVNSPAVNAEKYIVSHFNSLRINKEKYINESIALQKQLASIKHIEVISSECNYFLIKLGVGNASSLKDFLAVNHRILVRDASNFRGLNNSFIRIAVQSADDNSKLIVAIKDYISNGKHV